MNEVINFYQNNYDEDGRLVRHDLELIRSKEIISRYLIESRMSIADIGGASGVYSFWLAGLGHDAHLLDLTPRHIEQAKAKAESTGVQLASYTCADAMKLPFEDGSFDLVLEMGPLYHLQDRGDRLTCLKESYRILKDGCPVICAVISRYASMIDGFKSDLVKDAAFQKILEHELTTGCHENPEHIEWYFTTAYMHTPDEIKSELDEAGFTDIKLIAVEGFANALNEDELLKDEDTASCLFDILRKTENTPKLLGVSGHILAVGTKRQPPLHLVMPTLAHKQAVLEYRKEWLDLAPGDRINGSWGLQRKEYVEYEKWIRDVDGLTTGQSNNSKINVPATTYLAFCGERIIGNIQVRHTLNEELLKSGGHIGYGVRPSERRKGYASRMLALALEKCRELGIERALVTCDKDNHGSARAIQKNGGILENEFVNDEGIIEQRYWIELK